MYKLFLTCRMELRPGRMKEAQSYFESTVCILRHCDHLHTAFCAVIRNCDVINRKVLKNCKLLVQCFGSTCAPF